MERRKFLQNAGIAGILAAGAAPAVHAQAAPAIRWRLASSFPKALDTIYGAAETFSKAVSDATGGKFVISVHAGGELMPAFGVVDGVQQGTVECAHTAPYYFFGKDDTFAIDCAIPFGLNSRQMTAWMYEGNGMKLLREFYANYNIVNFPMGNTGAQMGGWYRKEIKSLADIKGLKMRIGGFGGKVLSAIGGVPQNIPGGEIYQALEKGTIDATEWVGPYDDEKLGFVKVAKHYYYPGWWEGGPQLSLYVNQKAYDALPADYKAVLASAASHAHVVMQAKYDAKNPAALKRLVAAGAKLHQFDKSIMVAAYEAAMALYDDLSNKNPAWKKVYSDYAAFRDEQHLWFRFTEAGFDNFMQTGRFAKAKAAPAKKK
ncbi:MAG: TRAP transporter substrate-binding protein [Sulfuritalea sp.]|nr:TRAP transporter substrate-binding protein [Sulfuritalea sp.]